MTKTKAVLLLITLAILGANFVAAQDASIPTEPPQELVIQVEVPATVHAVWQAFTTSDGLTTWLTPGNFS